MPDADYLRCKYSATVYTDDLAALHCLRSLAQFAESSGIPKSIPWGGTKEKDWLREGKEATFRFTTPVYREIFKAEAERLLPAGSFTLVTESDDDPARRQR